MKPEHLEAARDHIAALDSIWAQHDDAVTDGKPFNGPVVGPAMLPCVCGGPLYVHSGKGHTGESKATGCGRYRRDPADAYIERALASRESTLPRDLEHARRLEREKDKTRVKRGPGQWGIGPSDATNCPRAIWYRENPPEGFVRAWEDKGAALMGTLLHDAFVRGLQVVYPWREFEVPVVLDGLDTENSKADDYDPILCMVTDYKTSGDWKWEANRTGPDSETWDQVRIYGLALSRMGKPVRTLRLVYVHREKGKSEEFVIPYVEADAVTALERLAGYALALDLGLELPRHPDRTGPTNDGLCRGCFARVHCWNMDVAAKVGRSPESVTMLGVEPIDPDIEWAILEAVDAAAAALAAKKAAEAAKTLIEGIPVGIYGAAEIAPGDKPKVNAWAYAALLESKWSLPEGQRPRLDEIPKPVTKDSAPKPKRRRAAVVAKETKGKPRKPAPVEPDSAEEAAS